MANPPIRESSAVDQEFIMARRPARWHFVGHEGDASCRDEA
jgi:hypothetical protein